MTYSELIMRKNIAQKMKFSIKYFFSKCDQIRSFLQILSDLLNKPLMKKLQFPKCPTCVSVSHLVRPVFFNFFEPLEVPN